MGAYSTPAARAAARDMWAVGSPATRAAVALEWITAAALTAGLLVAGSLQF